MTDVLPEKVKEAMVTQIPLGRMAKAEEVAAVTTFLASDFASSYYRSSHQCRWRHGNVVTKLDYI